MKRRVQFRGVVSDLLQRVYFVNISDRSRLSRPISFILVLQKYVNKTQRCGQKENLFQLLSGPLFTEGVYFSFENFLKSMKVERKNGWVT